MYYIYIYICIYRPARFSCVSGEAWSRTSFGAQTPRPVAYSPPEGGSDKGDPEEISILSDLKVTLKVTCKRFVGRIPLYGSPFGGRWVVYQARLSVIAKRGAEKDTADVPSGRGRCVRPEIRIADLYYIYIYI